ncbi:histone H2A deubiquitinase MYSM1-like [Diorhabda carinulata]|uniref:histone H2A deubiquitinase MYSM1-like n=1 Tax=Diorhabda carinulata TaxID=1163345 RepID=UPI0025A04DED|nr:histone H2A deubiquitinase MYSM1-like [Diorhabda carinulata]
MADEDEIDILGDFQLDSDTNLYDGGPLISQNSELLNCDYTIHPQWLLDRPSTNPDNWYDTSVSTNSLEKSQPPEIDALGLLSTENCITDESGWTEKEKSLLESGMEIFGKSNIRLSQFIGSKTAPEVKYYLKNFYLENHVNKKSNDNASEGDIINGTHIPASIEEVVAVVSTAKPTIQLPIHNPRKKITSTLMEVKDSERSRDRSPLKKKSGIKSNRADVDKIHRIIGGMRPKSFKIKSKMKCNRIIQQETEKNNVFKRVEITTGQGLSVPICKGEQIIKLKQTSEDSDTDVEVDVEVSDEETKPETTNLPTATSNIDSNVKQLPVAVQKDPIDLSKVSESVSNELKTLEIPKNELGLGDEITDIEKILNCDYFTGNSSKTPDRYLKIRNHIVNGWLKQKPKYLNKTISRQGLKNCGDVNSFGKIHFFLEQIGAINFGCDQVNYERPLIEVLQEKMAAKEKKKNENKNAIRDSNVSGNRMRNKTKFNNDGEGGYTMSHDEQGRVIKHTIVNENQVVKAKPCIRKPIIRLVYCRPFKNNKSQPYQIKINLPILLTMDFHSHTCLSEIMGLVAGYWSLEQRTMFINHYEPCLNMASSATHCDMCPISQAKAADLIHEKGLDIMGWFHSHPTFAPEPSNQDLETQQSVQRWIGKDKPCIGMIMSPFSLNGALVASPFTCMIVHQQTNVSDDKQLIPYKFNVEVEAIPFDLDEFMKNITRILRFDVGQKDKIDFLKPYCHSPNITFMEKYITSVRMHLAKVGTLDKEICERIINGIKNICDPSNF